MHCPVADTSGLAISPHCSPMRLTCAPQIVHIDKMTDRELLHLLVAKLEKTEADVAFYQEELATANETIRRLRHELRTRTFLESRWDLHLASASRTCLSHVHVQGDSSTKPSVRTT